MRRLIVKSSKARSLKETSAVPLRLILLGCGLWSLACSTNNTYVYPHGSEPDAGVPREPAAPGAKGAPVADIEAPSLELDVFGSVGARYWFVVSEEQVALMNAPYSGGGLPGPLGDIYTPGGEAGDVTFADHLLLTTPGDEPHTADFGKIQVNLVGSSTGRPWTPNTLPNFKLDADEFTPDQRIAGVEHLRLNNAVVGSIYREKLTLDLYRRLGYPAPRATYAWVSGSVWGPDVAVPYIAVESYRRQFCASREAELAGGCVNMWEFPGDIGDGGLAAPENCQLSDCDPIRAVDFELAAADTPLGDGYKAALSEWFDWDAFHEFQCLSWILGTGDDPIHSQNNLVLVERTDGKFQYLPYSVDISLGQEWHPTASLPGTSRFARGCQSDAQCWADTISTCDRLLGEFRSADPVAMLDDIHGVLGAHGMLRAGDEQRYTELRGHIEQRLQELPVELDQNREAPHYDDCEFPMVQCNGVCVFEEECQVCEPDPDPQPLPDAGVVADGGPAEVSQLAAPQLGGAADIALPPPIPPGEEPGACLPPIELYQGPMP